MTTFLALLRAQLTRSRHNGWVDQRQLRGNFGLAFASATWTAFTKLVKASADETRISSALI
jgi:hypothetical protein